MAQIREFGPVVAVFDDFSGLKTLIIPILRMGGRAGQRLFTGFTGFSGLGKRGKGEWEVVSSQ